MICPHCDSPIFKSSSDAEKLKARTSMLVLHKSGEVEINCAACQRGVLIPLAMKDEPFVLRKADARTPKLVIRKGP